MNSYRTDSPNQFHQLLVSVSRHFHVLKNGTLRFQQKPFSYTLKTVTQSSKTHLVHYLLKDHFSGAFYVEVCLHYTLFPVEEFLFRAWSKKQHFPFCGMPETLSVPKSVLEIAPGLPGLLHALQIREFHPTSGYQAGIREIQTWEEELQFKIGFEPQLETFTVLQDAISELMVEINDQVREKGTRIEVWSQHADDIKLPPSIEVFTQDYPAVVHEQAAPHYEAVTFEVGEYVDDDVAGRFCWGDDRDEVFQAFYDADEMLHYQSERKGKTALRKILQADPQFLDAYNSLGFVEIAYQRYAKALSLFRKAYNIGHAIIPEHFSGKIPWVILDNRPFLRTLHGLGISYLETGKLQKATDIFLTALRYNPGDNQGIRALAIQAYLAQGKYHQLLTLAEEYGDDILPDIPYGKVFACVKLGQYRKAEETLSRALQDLPLVADELVKTEHTPVSGTLPGTITFGGADQAYEYWKRVGKYWEQEPETIEFLKHFKQRNTQP